MNALIRSGCQACPAFPFCVHTYRGSFCSAQRAKLGADFDPMTLADSIREMDDSQLNQFLMEFRASILASHAENVSPEKQLAVLQSPACFNPTAADLAAGNPKTTA